MVSVRRGGVDGVQLACSGHLRQSVVANVRLITPLSRLSTAGDQLTLRHPAAQMASSVVQSIVNWSAVKLAAA